MAQQMSPEQAQKMFADALSGLGATQAQDPYTQLLAEFDKVPGGGGVTLPGDRGQEFSTRGGASEIVAESPTSGAVLYSNGAIYDPQSGRTLYPPDPASAASIPGSEPWLRQVQDSWGKDKVESWRSKLAEQGYDVDDKGGWGTDLINALREYHNARYGNGGRAVPLRGKTADISQREAIRKGTDFQALKEEVAGWFDVIEMDPGEEGKEFFAERIRERMAALAKKHPEWSLEQIQSGASMRVQKEFVNTPGVKSTLREAEEDEMDDTLRASIVSISQLGSI